MYMYEDVVHFLLQTFDINIVKSKNLKQNFSRTTENFVHNSSMYILLVYNIDNCTFDKVFYFEMLISMLLTMNAFLKHCSSVSHNS